MSWAVLLLLNKLSAFLIAALLLTSFFYFQDINAAYTPDLSIIRVSPYNYAEFDIWDFPKYQPGYYVEVANYGSSASPETNMDFYIKTFDNKTLKKTIKVPAMNAGSKRSVKFSMCANTEGSFKEGYAVVNPSKSFQERSYKNNIIKFGLKDVILKNSSKTVTEYYSTSETQLISNSEYFTVSQYNSPLSNKTGITSIKCNLHNPNDYWMYPGKFRLKIPQSMQNGTKIKITKSNGAYDEYIPNIVIDNETMELQLEVWQMKTFVKDITITITSNNLESKGALKEPIQIWDRYGAELTTYNRDVTENYTSYETIIHDFIASYTVTDTSSYTVHNQNVTKLIVTGDSRELYVAGWFITPKGSINNVTALYGANRFPGTAMTNGRYGISKKIRGYDLIGWEIHGSDIKGFSNFKSLGFSSWTWKETYT